VGGDTFFRVDENHPFDSRLVRGVGSFDEVWPIVLQWQELDASDLRQLLDERWSALSRVSLDSSAVWLVPLGTCGLTRWRRKPGAS